jgi:hypothetical protein
MLTGKNPAFTTRFAACNNFVRCKMQPNIPRRRIKQSTTKFTGLKKCHINNTATAQAIPIQKASSRPKSWSNRRRVRHPNPISVNAQRVQVMRISSAITIGVISGLLVQLQIQDCWTETETVPRWLNGNGDKAATAPDRAFTQYGILTRSDCNYETSQEKFI